MPSWILKWLFRGLITLPVIALLFLVWVLAVELYKVGFFTSTDDPTKIGTLVTGIVTALGVAIAIPAGYYAREQLLAGQKIARGDFLLRLDETFRQYQEIREKLRAGGEWYRGKNGPNFPQDLFVVENYMGLFGRIWVLIDEGMVDIDIVERFYGDRLFNIVINPKIYKRKLAILKRAKGWTDFIKLWKAIEKRRQDSRRWLPYNISEDGWRDVIDYPYRIKSPDALLKDMKQVQHVEVDTGLTEPASPTEDKQVPHPEADSTLTQPASSPEDDHSTQEQKQWEKLTGIVTLFVFLTILGGWIYETLHKQHQQSTK